MSGRAIILLVLALLAGARASVAQSDADIAVVRGRMVQELIAGAPDASQVPGWISSLRDDGTWPDLVYHSDQRNSWPVSDHLRRVLSLAEASRGPGAAPSVTAAVHKALDHWLERDYQSPNWWHNQIQVPQYLGQILLVLGTDATPEERTKAEVILNRSKLGMTGQNRVWMAQNVFMHGLLAGDGALMRRALGDIQDEVRVTTQEGIQPDESFHQHGPQQQFGNYGLAFAGTETHWAALVAGTGFALPPAKLAILGDFLLGGEQWVVWRDRMDISGLGRQLYPHAPQDRGRSVAGAFRTMKALDTGRAGQYDGLLAYFSPQPPRRNTLIGDRAFWRSDMIVHRTPDFYASVRLSSRRVLGNESINGENLQGALMGDGATYLYRLGDEYEDIFPVWDWHRLPGVTAYEDGPLPSFRTRNMAEFVGEVSDGRTGAAALDYAREGLTARKTWFFLDDGFVCLGAGIRADQDRPVGTGLEQCLLRGDVTIHADGRTTTLAAGTRQTLTHPDWVCHDGVGYLFMEPATVTLSSQSQSGTWKSIVASLSDATLTRPVFSLSMEHGRRPSGASYGYLVLPDADPDRLAASARHPKVRVLSNTTALQAVRDDAHGRVEAAFYEAGALTIGAGRQVRVDQPCMLMMEHRGTAWTVSVADPTQKLSTIHVTLPMPLSGPECLPDPASGESVLTVMLPEGGDAGRSVVHVLRSVTEKQSASLSWLCGDLSFAGAWRAWSASPRP